MILDAEDGNPSIPLDKESQPLTTFITECGRFMHLRILQEYLASMIPTDVGMMK